MALSPQSLSAVVPATGALAIRRPLPSRSAFPNQRVPGSHLQVGGCADAALLVPHILCPTARRRSHPARASASSGQEGTNPESSGDGATEQDPALGLGDWREFRARLVRAGAVPVVPADQSERRELRDDTAGGAKPVTEPQPSSTELPREANEPLPGGGTTPSSQAAGVLPKPSTWTHAIATPEQGCLVIAHPDAFGVSQQYFNQAVIFMFTHGDEGSAGVILNRPSQFTVGQVAGLDEFLPEFGAVPLYMGGDVGPTSLLCLHGVADLGAAAGAQRVCPGVFVGGSQDVMEHIRSGRSKAWDYRWFARYSGWAPGQLEREVNAGYWFLAACSPDIVLKHCVGLEKPLWREIMELMGGEYSELAKKTYGEK